jgi:HEAT repeat protein
MTRADALTALADSGRPEASGVATRFARDPDAGVRARALECLEVMGDTSFLDLVRAALSDDGALANAAGMERLVRWRHVVLLHDPSELMRAYAAWALGRLGAQKAVEQLQMRKRMESTGIVFSAITETLYRLRDDPDDLAALLGQMCDRNAAVRAFTAHSLVGVTSAGIVGKVQSALRSALMVESDDAARWSIEKNLREVERKLEEGAFDLG